MDHETHPDTLDAPQLAAKPDAHWSALLEASLDAIVAMDHRGRVVEFNAAAELMFGYRRADAVGRLMGDLIVPPALRDAHRAGLERYLDGGEPRVLGKRLELAAVRSSGEEFPVELTITRVAAPGPPLFAGYLRDITDRKRAEAALNRQVRQRVAVAEVGRHALSAPNLAAVAQLAADLAAEGLGAPAVQLHAVNGGGLSLLAQTLHGRRQPEWPESLVAAVIAKDSAVVRPPHDGQPAVLGIAVRAGGTVFGTLCAVVPPDEYHNGDAEFLESLANVLGAAEDRTRAHAALRTSQEQLDVIFRNVADAITVQDRGGALLYMNEAARDLLGVPHDLDVASIDAAALADAYEMMDANRKPLDAAQLPGRQVFAEKRSAESVIIYRIRATGEERWSRIRSAPVLGDDGEVQFAINIVQDVTDERRAEHAQGLLARVGATLGSSLDYEETLRRVAEAVVPDYADWCTVDLVDDDGVFRSVAVAHTDPAKVELLQRFRDSHTYTVDDDVPLAELVRTGRSQLVADIPDELLERAVPDPEQLEMIRGLGFRSSLIVPLRSAGRILGAIAMATAESSRRYGKHDIPVFEEMARRAAAAIENARLYTERNYIAQTLQRSLLPPYLPDIAGVEVAASYHSAGSGIVVGGDFYDVFRFDERRWAAAVGDVQGKGVEAAALVGIARHTLRAAALTASKPERVLRLVNRALLDHPTDRMCTAALAVVERTAGGLTAAVAVAGHPSPVVKRAGGTTEEVVASGTALGLFADVEFEVAYVDLAPGDFLVLYSDGVAPRGASLPEYAREVVAAVEGDGSAAGLATEIGRRVVEGQPDGYRDDTTLLVLRVS